MSLDQTYSEVTPSEELMLETLAARWRCGETRWTFSARMKRTAEGLAARGLVSWQSGIVEKTIVVWLTDAGMSACLDPNYTSPLHKAGWQAAMNRLMAERETVAQYLSSGNPDNGSHVTDQRFLDGISHAWSVLFLERDKQR